MSLINLSATLAILAVAGFAQGVFGLGFAMIATPLLALFLDYSQAVYLVAVPLFVLAIYFLGRSRRYLFEPDAPTYLIPGIVVGAVIGVWLQVSLPQRVSLIFLAGLLVFSVVVPWLAVQFQGAHRTFRRTAPGFGLLAGVTESALNVGAPFMVLLGGLARFNRVQLLIALNLCFAFGKAVQLGLLTLVAGRLAGLLEVVAAVAVSLVAYVAGDAFAGRWDARRFRLSLNVFLLLMATALLVRAVAFV
jgi:uncharacterized membrane protein YfcA